MTSIPNPSLKAGEAALQQGNYPEAIAHFQAICDFELDETLVTRAQQALVVAYSQNNQVVEAIALCEHLVEGIKTKDKNWAMQTLVDLQKRYPEAVAALQEERETGQKTKSETLSQSQGAESLLPVPTPSSEEIAATVYIPGRQWRNAARAKQGWKSLKKVKIWRLWRVQLITIFVFFMVFRFTLQTAMDWINGILVFLPWVKPLQLFYQNPTIPLLVFLGIWLIASPWILTTILTQFYGLKRFSVPKLALRHPEAAQTLQKSCRRYHLPLPKLGILPQDAPLIMTYGNLRRTAHIVVSEGLLNQLQDDEVATLYGFQLGYLQYQNFILMSSLVALLQLPYLLYWQLTQWGKQVQDRLRYPYLRLPFQGLIALLGAMFYSIYWLWRVTLLWFSRRSIYYGDRFAAELTGNPNGLSRGILKMAIGMAKTIEQQRHTNPLLESFDLLMPLGHRPALTLGSLPDYAPLNKVLAWECTNPYRHWLALNDSHALTGDRLYLLGLYGNFWKLQPEIDLPTLVPPAKTLPEKLEKLKNSYTALPILQSAVLSGLFFGVVFRGFLWIFGLLSDWLSDWVNLWRFIWLYNASSFLDACILFAFSLSLIIWINGYFPNIKISPTRNEPRLQDLLTDSQGVPPDSLGVRLTGKLLGRKGFQNGLNQDLILQTSSGSIKLHFYSILGPINNLFPQLPSVKELRNRQRKTQGLRHQLYRFILWIDEIFLHFPHPNTLINQEVIVRGWLRRSSTPWIDVDIIKPKTGKTLESGYPIWITILAVSSALYGAYLIWRV